MNSEKTAIARNTASRPLKDLMKLNQIHGDVIDYGCGKGMDSKYLREQGFNVVSYDPYYSPITLNKKFDTVICNYVINVIEHEHDRINLCTRLLDLLNIGGKLYITARTEKQITTQAKKNNWTQHIDGWITGRKTFQKGITTAYIQGIIQHINIKGFQIIPEIKSNSNYTIIGIIRTN